MHTNRLKTILFHAITLLPLFLLVCLLIGIGRHVYDIRRIDYDAVRSDLEDYLESDKGEFSVDANGDAIEFKYDYKVKGGPFKPSDVKFVLEHSPGDSLVYVFGSSPVVAKLFSRSENLLFPSLLEEKLNSGTGRGYRVYNFGVSSFDSFEIKELIRYTVDHKKPDLIIYYEGHMDYESAYLTVIKQRYYLFRGDIYKKIMGMLLFNKTGNLAKSAKVGDWFLRSLIEPNLINLLQMFDLVWIEDEPFREYDRMILEYYKKNISEIVSLARESGIPVIFVTPVANLEVKPFGIYRVTQKYYRTGMNEKDYAGRMESLIKAKDTEIFTGDIRAKTGMYDFLDGLGGQDVHVLDLQDELLAERFTFNCDYFYDVGHMKPPLHEIISEKLYDFIVARGILGQEGGDE